MIIKGIVNILPKQKNPAKVTAHSFYIPCIHHIYDWLYITTLLHLCMKNELTNNEKVIQK